VSPEVPRASDRIIMPGNRRIRFFDLAEGRSRVVLKDGFSSDAIEAELAIRAADGAGPFPPILAHNCAAGWFTEPIFDGLVLARVASRSTRRHCLDLAQRTLSAWAAPKRRFESTEDWWERNTVARLHLGDLLPVVEALIGRFERVEVQPSHGDFQPGNILVAPDHRRTWLLDWEFHGIRSVHYDTIVLMTGLRWPERAEAAIVRAIAGRLKIPSFKSLTAIERRRAVVLALVEDITLRLRGWDGQLDHTVPPALPALLRLIRCVAASGVE